MPQVPTMRRFVSRTLVVFGIGALAFIAWHVRTAVILAFGGVLLAIFLDGLTERTVSWTGLSRRWALTIVLVVLFVLIAGVGIFLGNQIASQFGELAQRVSAGIRHLPGDLQSYLAEVRALLSSAAKWAIGLVQGLGYALLIVVTGIYLAAAPGRYRHGVILLFPPRRHERVRQVLDAIGTALWRWLLGTFAAMAAVGLLTLAGLLALGVPAALALAVTAGLLEFVPVIGPWASAVPAVLVAVATGGVTQAIYVALLYLGIQQIESNIIYPLIQRRAASVPPAMTVFAVVVFGLLFGLPGVLFATPLLIAVLVTVNMLYVHDTLGEHAQFPASGSPAPRADG